MYELKLSHEMEITLNSLTVGEEITNTNVV